MEQLVLGIDIGGTFTKMGLVNSAGEILNSKVISTGSKGPFADFLAKLKVELDLIMDIDQEKFKVVAVGVGAPNSNMHTGEMEDPPNFEWGNRVPLARAIQKVTGLPTHIANDANAAALGELTFGHGKGLENFVVLTLGTGLGSGIVLNGQLFTGHYGMAGELGHINVEYNGRKCNCGLRGCLENYVSVTGLKRTVFELLSEMKGDSPLRRISFDDLTGEKISEAALHGDAIAIKAYRQTGQILGRKLADTAAHLDPQAFILAGGLAKAGNLLLDPTVASLEEHVFVAYRGKIKVALATGPSANSILGPAALALRSIGSFVTA